MRYKMIDGLAVDTLPDEETGEVRVCLNGRLIYARVEKTWGLDDTIGEYKNGEWFPLGKAGIEKNY